MEIDKMTAGQCVAAIIAEMDAVKKAKGDNVNYKFRNVDAVMDAINPYLGKYGLAPNTEVISFTSGAFEAVKKGYNGAPDTIVRKTTGSIHVRVSLVKDIWTENGQLVSTKVSFEGTASSDDSGDKALTQAQSNAMKYALIFGFCMKSDDKDPDDKNEGETVVPTTPPPAPKTPTTPPPPTPPPAWTPEVFDVFKSRIVNMPIARNKKQKDFWAMKYRTDEKGEKGIFCNMTNEQAKAYVKHYAAVLKEQGIEIPTELA